MLLKLSTVYHESFEAEKFHGFRGFLHVCKTFLYESSRWRLSNMDLRESMWDSAKVFSRRFVRTTCREKLFCLETFMVYGKTQKIT